MSCIKSIQRGTTSISNSITITISKVDPNKCVVLLNGNAWDTTPGLYASSLPYLKSITETSLTISASKWFDPGPSAIISWQVIEFT